MRESRYQASLIDKLHNMLPGCVVLKNDSSYMQGVPDLIVLFEDHWGMLEVKKGSRALFEPNQEYYIELFNEMSFASFIEPSTEEDVLYELQRSFGIVG